MEMFISTMLRDTQHIHSLKLTELYILNGWFFFQRFFKMWTIFKIFIEFITILLLFYGFIPFGHEACGILAPQPGIKPIRLAMEGEVLTTQPEEL